MNTSGFSKEQATLISFRAMAVALLFQPLLGAVSDRVGRRPVLLFFGIGATLGTVPVLRLLAHASSAGAAFGLLVAALFVVSAYTSFSAVVKAELFPTQVRALGVGLPCRSSANFVVRVLPPSELVKTRTTKFALLLIKLIAGLSAYLPTPHFPLRNAFLLTHSTRSRRCANPQRPSRPGAGPDDHAGARAGQKAGRQI